MALTRYLLTLGLCLLGGVQIVAAAFQHVYALMLIHSLALPLTFITLGGLFLLWFPWRGLLMLLIYNNKTDRWRWPVVALLSAVLGAIIYLRVQQPESASFPPHPIEADVMRIASLNALHPNDNLGPKVKFILETNPDVMSIVEARPDWDKYLPRLARQYPNQIVTQVASNYGDYSMILLSKYPVRRVLIQDEGRIVHYDVDGPNGTFRLVQVHPYSPLTPARHLARNAALDSLSKVETDLPVVITGDFNTVPWQRNIQNLMTRFGLKMAGLPQPTFPAYRVAFYGRQWRVVPVAPLDYVLVPENTQVLASDVRYVPATDHLAVVADVRLMPH